MVILKHDRLWRAVLTVWGIVNLVNILQSAGFLSRVWTGSHTINHYLGYGIIALALPSAFAIITLVRARAGVRQLIGPLSFLVFVVFMIAVEYIWQVEFRDPVRNEILVPYLLLFFGSIFLMGVPMFRIDKHLWMITLATTILLLASMGLAMVKGVG